MLSFQIFSPDSIMNTFLASIFSGIAVVTFMTPFDVVSTRLYNQPTDASGVGIIYKNMSDCFNKIFKKEGLWGFYKGWAPSLFRLAPHTILSLMFWDYLRKMYFRIQHKPELE